MEQQLSELTDAQLVTRLTALAEIVQATGHSWPTRQLEKALAEAVKRSIFSIAEVTRAVSK